jgi:hypothetical protein
MQQPLVLGVRRVACTGTAEVTVVIVTILVPSLLQQLILLLQLLLVTILFTIVFTSNAHACSAQVARFSKRLQTNIASERASAKVLQFACVSPPASLRRHCHCC